MTIMDPTGQLGTSVPEQVQTPTVALGGVPVPAMFQTQPPPSPQVTLNTHPAQPPPNLVFGGHLKPQREPVLVTLVGVNYWATPVKARKMAQMFAEINKLDENDPLVELRVVNQWVGKLFRNGDDAQKILDRLDDEDDSLDSPHISQLIKALAERMAAPDPTTSPSDSQQ